MTIHLFPQASELRTALFGFVSRSSEEFCTRHNFSVAKDVDAVLSESLYRLVGTLATDLEAFAKHAKRSTINAADVRLCARRNPSLVSRWEMEEEEGESEKEEGGRKKWEEKREEIDR